MKRASALGVFGALMVGMAVPVTAVTTPATGAEAKAADFVIVPPWVRGTHEVTCAYGCGIHDGTDTRTTANDFHALDFDLALGESVHPVADGVVLYAAAGTGGWAPYGELVYVEHGETGYTSIYAHLDSIDVEAGEFVTTSTRLGGAGMTGTDDVHLHLALFEGASHEAGDQPYGGRSVVPEPFARCAGDCEDLVQGSRLTRTVDGSGESGVPSAQWIEPVEGAEVGPRLTLAAWPTPTLEDGSLVDDTDTVRVDFHAVVDGAEVAACSADQVGADGRWSCEADLVALGVAVGDVQLSFELFRVDGTVVSAPDGLRTVVFAAPLSAVWVAPPQGKLLEAPGLTRA